MKSSTKYKFYISGDFTVNVESGFEIDERDLRDCQNQLKDLIYKKLEIFAGNNQYEESEKIKNVKIKIEIKDKR